MRLFRLEVKRIMKLRRTLALLAVALFYVQEYGTLGDVPLDIYIENIMAIRPILRGLTEAFADPKTGIGADPMDIDPDEVEQYFYEKCVSHLEDVMNLEQKEYETAGQFAVDKYTGVTSRFTYILE